MTGSKEGQELLYKCNEIVAALKRLAEDPDATVSKESLLCLVNLSAEDEGATFLLETVTIARMHFFKANSFLVHILKDKSI